jgi:hypothetical protein
MGALGTLAVRIVKGLVTIEMRHGSVGARWERTGNVGSTGRLGGELAGGGKKRLRPQHVVLRSHARDFVNESGELRWRVAFANARQTGADLGEKLRRRLEGRRQHTQETMEG